MNPLFSPWELGGLRLPNRVVMAPMTRARAEGGIPDALTATYYAQRASAGLIVTESAQVSPGGRGYLGTPGIHSAAQIAGWTRVTEAVHRAGGRIFIQLWHVGRVSHTSLMEDGASPVGPTAAAARDTLVQAHDAAGLPDQVAASQPVALDIAGIQGIVADFRQAAQNAMAAGFDGVEIHAGNGYLFEQFINGGLNTRTDRYGGPVVANRLRLLLETVDAVAAEIGPQRVGIRITPYARQADLHTFPGEALTWLKLAVQLSRRKLAYLHASHLGDDDFGRVLRSSYRGALMLAGGFDAASAREALGAGTVDLVAFGTPFIANPDLVERMRENWPLAQADRAAFYGGGARGYTDYPPYRASENAARQAA